MALCGYFKWRDIDILYPVIHVHWLEFVLYFFLTAWHEASIFHGVVFFLLLFISLKTVANLSNLKLFCRYTDWSNANKNAVMFLYIMNSGAHQFFLTTHSTVKTKLSFSYSSTDAALFHSQCKQASSKAEHKTIQNWTIKKRYKTNFSRVSLYAAKRFTRAAQ